MGNPLQQAGTFRGVICGYGIPDYKRKENSQSQAIQVTVQIHEAWDEGTQLWEDWRDYDMELISDLWVIKKDGTINKIPSEALVKHAGWDGNLMAVVDGTWQPTPCQFVVKREVDQSGTYDDKYKIDYINGFDNTPGSGKAYLSPDQAKALAAKYGSQFRALAGSAKQNAAPPAGKKPMLPAKQQTQQKAAQTVKAEGQRMEDEINKELNQTADDIPF